MAFSGDASLAALDGALRGEDDRDARALSQRALEIQPPAMDVDQTLDDRQPEAGAAFGAGDVRPAMPDTVEELLLIFRSDTDAGVRNAELDLTRSIQVGGNFNAAARRRVFDRIRQQIVQDL